MELYTWYILMTGLIVLIHNKLLYWSIISHPIVSQHRSGYITGILHKINITDHTLSNQSINHNTINLKISVVKMVATKINLTKISVLLPDALWQHGDQDAIKLLNKAIVLHECAWYPNVVIFLVSINLHTSWMSDKRTFISRSEKSGSSTPRQGIINLAMLY